MPALETSTSTGPCSASTALNAASTEAASVTSHWTANSPSTGSPDLEVTVTLAAIRREAAGDREPDPPVAPGHQHRTPHDSSLS